MHLYSQIVHEYLWGNSEARNESKTNENEQHGPIFNKQDNRFSISYFANQNVLGFGVFFFFFAVSNVRMITSKYVYKYMKVME